MGFKVLDKYGYRVRQHGETPWIDIEHVFDELGWPVVGRLLDRFRGSRVFIPRNSADLARAVGAQHAARLCEHFGGRSCLLPADPSALIERRDLAIREDHRAGMSRTQLREKYEMGDQEILNALRMIEG